MGKIIDTEGVFSALSIAPIIINALNNTAHKVIEAQETMRSIKESRIRNNDVYGSVSEMAMRIAENPKLRSVTAGLFGVNDSPDEVKNVVMRHFRAPGAKEDPVKYFQDFSVRTNDLNRKIASVTNESGLLGTLMTANPDGITDLDIIQHHRDAVNKKEYDSYNESSRDFKTSKQFEEAAKTFNGVDISKDKRYQDALSTEKSREITGWYDQYKKDFSAVGGEGSQITEGDLRRAFLASNEKFTNKDWEEVSALKAMDDNAKSEMLKVYQATTKIESDRASEYLTNANKLADLRLKKLDADKLEGKAIPTEAPNTMVDKEHSGRIDYFKNIIGNVEKKKKNKEAITESDNKMVADAKKGINLLNQMDFKSGVWFGADAVNDLVAHTSAIEENAPLIDYEENKGLGQKFTDAIGNIGSSKIETAKEELAINGYLVDPKFVGRDPNVILISKKVGDEVKQYFYNVETKDVVPRGSKQSTTIQDLNQFLR